MERVGVIGLGYVGLPLAAALSRHYPTVGFDTDEARASELREGVDRTGEVEPSELGDCFFTSNETYLKGCTVYIVAVPTPVDSQKRPDFGPLRAASRQIGSWLRAGDVVVYESTVYPGATEEVCVPELEAAAKISRDQFQVAYSPERINPGDKVHTLQSITKVVGAQDERTLERVAAIYEQVVEAGVHRAPSIRVAEAAKIAENIQRDVNIALVNELALVFDRLGITAADVFDASATKWNWLRFHPGLVGGHCIGVDPYYMAAKAEEVGVAPQVIISGRRVNDSMGQFLAGKVVQQMCREGMAPANTSVVVIGAAFKPDVPDTRNSKAFDVLDELRAFNVSAAIYDPHVGDLAARGYPTASWADVERAEVVVVAVPHTEVVARLQAAEPSGFSCRVLCDLHGALKDAPLAAAASSYWRL